MTNAAETITSAAPGTSSGGPTTYTIFMLVKTTTEWLALAPAERFAFLGSDIEPLLHRNRSVRMRFFDTEFFNGDVTDVIVWETADLTAYRAVVEGLRESRFWDRYCRVVSILPGVENAYAEHYGMKAVGQ